MQRWSLAVLLLVSCGPKPAVRTALQGNLADLRRDIANAQRSGKLDQDMAVKLAQAVGERELTSAEGNNGALRVRSLRSCAFPLRGAMEERAKKGDDVAAELTLILVESHAADRTPLLTRYVRVANGAWRAVAARAARRPVDTDLRKTFYFDPDARVRRAALTTAVEVHDAGELEPLLEAARLDPDPQSRSLAVRAVGSLGGERAVLALKDSWTRADDTLRLAIVDAWSEHASYVAGGARELSLAAQGNGMAAVSASYALAAAGGPESVVANDRLCRNILEGTDDEKRLALNIAPMNPATEAAIVKAAHEASADLRVVALTRLSLVPARRVDSIHALRDLANAKPGSEAESRARDAAVASLASAGDTSVAASLIKDLHDKQPQTRARAARGLTRLGDYTHAASALADEDANLRSEVACAILARESQR